MLTLPEIVGALTGTPSMLDASLIISEAAIDSRLVIPAAMFVAIAGERVDGHEFVQEAFDHGAELALVQHPVGDEIRTIDIRDNPMLRQEDIPSPPFCLLVDDTVKAMQKIAAFHRLRLDVKVIGITGSVGKSTTKELVADLLGTRFRTLRNIGNLNNEIGLPLTLLKLGKGHERAVLEMGFYVPGEISLLCELALPTIGVITNIGTVHAERAGSQEVIAKGKAELIKALPAHGTAILNYDDPLVKPMAELTDARVLFYGLDPAADLWADQIKGLGLEGIRLSLHYENETFNIRVPLIGRHSVHTVLRAVAVGLVENLTWHEIITGLTHSHTQLRMVAVHSANGALILDDTYNASPESMLAALNLLDEMKGEKLAVLGEMRELGSYRQRGHEMVGARTAEVCQELITVGENGSLIAEAALRAGMDPKNVMSVLSVPEAIDLLKTKNLDEGKVVLIKGAHGLRMERIVSALEAAI